MDVAAGAGGCGGGGSGPSGDDHASGKHKKQYHRHPLDVTQRLEAVFKEQPHPDEKQRQQLSRELGLDAKQIKFWFQNKRTQTKAQNERSDNHSLKAENERFQYENIAMKEALKNVICLKCEGSGCCVEARGHDHLQRLRNENVWLAKEYERVSNMVSSFYKKRNNPLESFQTPVSRISLNNFYDHPRYFGQGFMGGRGGGGGGGGPPRDTLYGIDHQHMLGTSSMNPAIPLQQNHQFPEIHELERSVMVETAVNAMDELMELLSVNEPLWIRSSTDGRLMIHRESYNNLYPKIIHVNSPVTWIESSKESEIVPMAAMNLLDIVQDPKKWMDFFPSIVTKARIVEVLDTRNRGGSLCLMHEKLHVLSPFIPPREFMFLRYIRQLSPTTWLMVQVSYDSFKQEEDTSSSQAWMLPSGCMIQDMPNGKSKVTWVEHVEVDDKSLTHQIYEDLVCQSFAYGAKRWLVTLERMCERHAFSVGSKTIYGHELERVIDAPQSRASMTNLAHRMVKGFHGVLSMPEKPEFPQLSQFQNNGFRVSFRKSDFASACQLNATIVCVATSLKLPVSFESLFKFFKDDKARAQWDVLSSGNPIQEIAHISTGNHPGNSISLMQPYGTNDNASMLILQESNIDSLGASLIYAPIDFPAVTSILSGQDSRDIPMLPSGFIISSNHGGGVDDAGICLGVASSSSIGPSTSRVSSLLTVALQILVPANDTPSEEPKTESVAAIHALINSTIQKIKRAICDSVIE